jgi:tripartite-type tricarboxylate transporter receptor subunit TctC
MKLPRRQFSRLAGIAAILSLVFAVVIALLGHSASSQPTRIRIINPFPPGGTADLVARALGEQIGSSRGVTVLVENRPGAGTVVGTEAASRAAPDGNTLLITTPVFVVNPHFRKLNYDPLTSFEPICNLVVSPQVIVVNSESPYRTLADLLNAARAKPGELTLAGVGPATTSHIAFETLKRAANVNMTFIPYPGNAPVVNAILGGHVTSASTNYADVVEHLNAGKLRALATPSRTRVELLPDVPTVAEFGYQEVDLDVWFGLFAPANTPKEALSRLAGWFTAASQVPEVKARLAVQGLYPVGMCGADFAAHLRKQYEDFGRVIREANIKAE